MRAHFVKYTIAAVFLLLVILCVKAGAWWWTQKQWFDLQKQQLATIERLADFPPTGWHRRVWENALVTPYNVWGNVTFHPSYSNISIEEMQSLHHELEQIVRETTTENSIHSVDRVFELLLQRGRKIEFITGFREEFQSYSPNSSSEHRRRFMQHAA